MNQASHSQDHIEPLPTVTSGSTSKATYAARKKQALSTPNVHTTFQSRKIVFLVLNVNLIIAESSFSEMANPTQEVDDIVILEGACANETSLVILDILDVFAQKFGVMHS